jgi:uncharacterized repeat protein (TIGR01451 family)
MKRTLLLTLTILSLAASGQIPTAGLIAGYSFNGNANDESPNNNDGILHGVTSATARDGTPNGAFHFNGLNNYIEIPFNSSLNPTLVTVCTVVRPTGFYSGHCQGNTILYKGHDHTNGFYSLNYLDNVYDDNDCFNFDSLHQTFASEIGTNIPASLSQQLYTPYILRNTWYCVVSVYDGSTIKLYVDAVLKFTIPLSNPLGTNSAPISIGCNLNDTVIYPYWLNADLDDIRIYNRPLTPLEIMNYYVATGGLIFDHQIHGNIYDDSTQDCQMQSVERRIPYFTLTANPGNYFTFSDDSGNYSLGVNDTAIYSVEPIIPQYLAPLINNQCPVNYLIDINPSVAADTGDFNFGLEVADCALLRVDVTSNIRRRCFRNQTTVYYINDGVVQADSVEIYVRLDQYDIPLSASLPYTLDTATNTMIFSIGTLAAGQSGIISIVDSIACVPGITDLTQCTEAWILPPNQCLIDSTTDSTWDHSSVSVDAACVNDTCRFVIRNSGSQDMDAPSEYRIYANNVLVYTGSFQLVSGDSLVVLWVSNGATIRLEADQVPGHPGNSHPRATLEACGDDGSGNFTVGEYNRAPMDDEDVDVEIDCMEIRDSYDPNEKDNSPLGVDAAHIVLPNTPIDYTVHFQNTGTDTAYKVVVIDSVSNDLDLATLELGASSHPYSVSLSGQGIAVLKFTFNNINLVDSTTDELNSHGFVKYKITPKSSVPLGTQINNAADIYFDYNFPVRTNTAYVTLGNYLVLSNGGSKMTKAGSIIFYPNPTTSSITIESSSDNLLQKVDVYSYDGRLIKSLVIGHSSLVKIDMTELSAGVYFLDCKMESGSGKVKVVKY